LHVPYDCEHFAMRNGLFAYSLSADDIR
jgi:hypothetical protein